MYDIIVYKKGSGRAANVSTRASTIHKSSGREGINTARGMASMMKVGSTHSCKYIVDSCREKQSERTWVRRPRGWYSHKDLGRDLLLTLYNILKECMLSITYTTFIILAWLKVVFKVEQHIPYANNIIRTKRTGRVNS